MEDEKKKERKYSDEELYGLGFCPIVMQLTFLRKDYIGR